MEVINFGSLALIHSVLLHGIIVICAGNGVTMNINHCQRWNGYNGAIGAWELDEQLTASECTYEPTVEPTTEPTVEPTLSPNDVPDPAMKHAEVPQNGPWNKETESDNAGNKEIEIYLIIIGGGALTLCLVLLCIGFYMFYRKKRQNSDHVIRKNSHSVPTNEEDREIDL